MAFPTGADYIVWKKNLSLDGDNVTLTGGGGTFSVGTATSVASNTTKLTNVSYGVSGLLTTDIAGILKVSGDSQFTNTATFDSGIVLQGLAPQSYSNQLVLNTADGAIGYATIVQPAFVYFVATNGRAGASGSITDPFDTVAEALTQPGDGTAGKTIYIAPGSYTEDVNINITRVSIIGMSDNTQSSKRARFTSNWTVSATATSGPTIDVIVLNNLEITAKVGGYGINFTGAGCRLVIQNCLITSLDTVKPTIQCAAVTGGSPAVLGQIAFDNASITTATAGGTGTTNCLDVVTGVVFSIKDSDFTQNGLGIPFRITSPAQLFGVTNSTFECKNAAPTAISIVSTGNAADRPVVFNGCSMTATPTSIAPIISIGSTGAVAQVVGLVSCNITSKGTSDNINTAFTLQTGGNNTMTVTRCNLASATGGTLSVKPFKASSTVNSIFWFSNLFFAATLPALTTFTMPTVGDNFAVFSAIKSQ